MIAAADTFRAAAVEQLKYELKKVMLMLYLLIKIWISTMILMRLILKKSIDLLLVDTAGRLQTKNNLMDELAKIKKIIDKKAPDAIIESLLVLDASQGPNGLKQAKSFAKSAVWWGNHY